MSLLYFGAVGVAFLNDRRRRRADPYAGLADDEISPLDDTPEAVQAGAHIAPPTAVEPPMPLDRRYDDST
jgi:sec-independent protein translocase protein TatC